MSANSKIFIASKDVLIPLLGADTTKDHLYLIYDEDGNAATTTDELIIRGGPESEGGDPVQGPVDNIKLEINRVYGAGSKDYDVAATATSRNFTQLTLPAGKTADAVWNDLITYATGMQNGSDEDGNGRPITNVPYELPYLSYGSNSNSVIGTLLAMEGIDIFKTLPREGGTGRRISSGTFPSAGHFFVTGSGTSTINAYSMTEAVTDYGNGDTTIKVDANVLEVGKTLLLYADSSATSVDVVRLTGVDPLSLRFSKTSGEN